ATDAEIADPHRCQYRPAEQRPSGHAYLRPRYRFAPRHYPADARQLALRSLRAGPGFDHVYGHQPVSRGARSGTEVLAVAGELERRVYPGRARESGSAER